MGANIKIQSESKQFITEMKQVTDNLKLVDSTLSVATEKAKLFGNAQEQLQAKNAQLGNSLKSNTTLLGLQNKTISALANDVTKYKSRNSELVKSIGELESKLKEQIKLTGEDSKEVKQLQTFLSGLQREYSANEKEIIKSNTSMDKYKLKMNEVEKAILQDRKALEELNRTPSKMDKVNTGIDNTKSKLASLKNAFFGITATVATGAGLFKFTEGAIEAGDNAYKLSQKLHLSTTESAQLNKVLNITGTESKPLISTITRLDKALEGAGEKGNVTTKILKDYGVSLTDANGKLIPMNSQLEQLAKAYKKASDAGQEEAFTAQVLGNKGTELIPLLENYNEAKEEASKVKGIGIDPKMAHETAEEMKVLKMQVSATGGVLAKSLVPLVQSILPPTITFFQNLTEKIKENKLQIDKFITSSIEIGKGLGSIVIPVIRTLFEFISEHGTASKNIVLGLGLAFGGLHVATSAINSVTNTVKTFKDGLKGAKDAAGALKDGISFLGSGFSSIKNFIGGGIEAITSFGKATGEALISVGKMTIELATQAGSWIAQKIALVASTIATGAMTVAQTALNFVMSLNPLTLIIIGLTALVAGIVVAYNKVDWFRNMVNGAFTAIKNTAIWAFNGIKDFLVNWGSIILIPVAPFLGIPLTIMQHWNQIKDFFSNLGNWLKQKLHDMFSFELPHIKLPHFSLTGEFSLSKGTIPHLGVEWYAKGGIMTQPTVFGMNGNNAMVGGEAGAEAVLPLQQLWNQLDKNFERLEQRLNVNKQQVFVIQGQDIYMDGQKVGRVTSKYVNQEMAWNG